MCAFLCETLNNYLQIYNIAHINLFAYYSDISIKYSNQLIEMLFTSVIDGNLALSYNNI